MKKLVKKSNNTYVVAINDNDKNIKRKRHYLIDNLIYANKIGILSQYAANQLCDFVIKNNLNNNKMLIDRVYDICKLYKNGVYSAYKSAQTIYQLIRPMPWDQI